MILWSFKGVELTFRSTPAKLQRDIQKMAKATGTDPNTEIIYHNAKFAPTTTEGDTAVDDNTTDNAKSVLPKTTKKRKARRKKTTKLSNVHGVVDKSDADVDSVGSSDSGLDSAIGDSSVFEQRV